MVRIRLKIIDHDGESKKTAVWRGLGKAGAFVYKVIETREAFLLITNGTEAEKVLKDEMRQYYLSKGLEVQVPPEYSALKTLMVKGVGWGVFHKSEQEITEHVESVYPNWKLENIIKIPNNETLMKIVCKSPRVADEIVEKGITIFSQRFDGRSLEREVYINVSPCMRCYKYDHFTKKCKAPESYVICSECARTGHRFHQCNSQQKKCINCGQNHRTLAYKCPKRKEVIKQKVKEKKEKDQKIPEGDVRKAVERQIREDLPENYLVIVSSAIALAEIREKECPGTYQYIMDEMYRANGLPTVKIPATVIAGYEHHKIKKRAREEPEIVGGADEGEELEEILVGATSMQYATSTLRLTEPPTPMQSPASTPAATPVGTPAQSPLRVIPVKTKSTKSSEQAVKAKEMRPPPGPQRKKEKKEEEMMEEAGVVLFTFKESRLPKHKLDHQSKVGFLKNSQILKYIYRNKTLDRGAVWQMILQKKINLNDNAIYEVDRDQYEKVPKGSYLDLKVEKISLQFRQV